MSYRDLTPLVLCELLQSSIRLYREHLANSVRVVLTERAKYARLIQTRKVCVRAFESIFGQCSANEASPSNCERVAVTLFYILRHFTRLGSNAVTKLNPNCVSVRSLGFGRQPSARDVRSFKL